MTDQRPPKLPPSETEQPDPFLQMSAGRLAGGGLALVAAVIAFVLGVVLYGLNGPNGGAPPSASPHGSPAAANNPGSPAPAAPRKTDHPNG
jgi:hypothetical protein